MLSNTQLVQELRTKIEALETAVEALEGGGGTTYQPRPNNASTRTTTRYSDPSKAGERSLKMKEAWARRRAAAAALPSATDNAQAEPEVRSSPEAQETVAEIPVEATSETKAKSGRGRTH